jgi:hypothetical protein
MRRYVRFRRVSAGAALIVAFNAHATGAQAEGSRAEDPYYVPTPPRAAPPAIEPTYDLDRTRLRFGFDANGGAIVGRGVAHTVAIRLGVQATRVLGAYYQAQAGVFAGRDFGGLMFNSIMGSLVLNDIMELSAGPSLDLRSGTMPTRQEGVYGGVATRVAFMLGADAKRPGNRSGLSLSFHAHPTFVRTDNTTFVRTLFAFGLGGEWY